MKNMKKKYLIKRYTKNRLNKYLAILFKIKSNVKNKIIIIINSNERITIRF